MDSTFVKYIEEIEKLYIHLPKSQRVRIEKWVEKLVSIGSNVVWRKHRNAYTKLLLNMVISKNISEPFNSLPPEGPLPSYPFHIKPITKDLIGVHETTFWRDLYKRLQEQDTKEHISLSHLDRSYHSGLPQSKSSPFGSNPLSREIDNLQILIKEQEQKILLLEQQLHEDRVKHELQIQRINYSHRMEIHQLLQNTQSNDGSQVPLSSHKLPSFLSHREVFPEKDFSLNRTSFGHVSINRSSSPTFESSNVFSKAKHISPNSHNTHINSAVTQNQWNQYDYNSNRLYQSYPSSNQTQPTEFESTRKFSGFEERSERNYQQPDFTATLLRDHPPIIPVPSDAMRDDSMNTSQVAFITNKQLFDNSRSIIDPHDISVSAAIPNPHIPEEFIRKDHSLSPTPVPDIIPSRKPSMTENSSMSSVEPNITHIPVHKQSQPLPNPVTYGNNITGTGIAEIFSSQNNQFLHEVSPEVEEDDEGEYELRGGENGGLLEKESSDEDFLNYLDKFQQQISIINVDS